MECVSRAELIAKLKLATDHIAYIPNLVLLTVLHRSYTYTFIVLEHLVLCLISDLEVHAVKQGCCLVFRIFPTLLSA